MPSFIGHNVRLLVVGLAPGLHGANRTGRPFTGDWAGDLLYATLLRHGLAKGEYRESADDGLELVDCAIANAVRCVPPQNKPLPAEIRTCRQFLTAQIAAFRICARSWRWARSPMTASAMRWRQRSRCIHSSTAPPTISTG